MILNERDSRHEHLLNVARQMMTAARTAPKGKGIDIIEVAVVTGAEIEILAKKMKALFEENGLKFFLRDAENILHAECIVLIGTREQTQGLNCGHCGFATCAERSEGVPCALNSIDVGIAVGSACATAADLRVDTRVMFSAGLAAQCLHWLEGCKMVMAIPVSASSKNPFFDRKPKAETSAPFLPAEWFPQSGVQLTWPHAQTDWAYMLPEVQECFVHIAREIAKRELLLIVTPEPEAVREQIEGEVCMSRVRFCPCETNDTWARDHGAITLIDNGAPSLLDFTFNGWGKKFAAELDNEITRQAAEAGLLKGKYTNHRDFVLEGGSIESDGRGTLLTTSQCLLAPHRNEPMNREEIEEYLRSAFHLQQVLWLDHGYLAGDDTDSHVDTLARLCSPTTIAYVQCTDKEDEHYEALRAMEEQLKTFRTPAGEPYRLLPLPMVDKIEEEGERLPATYANFLILNGAVLYPTYKQPENDQQAKKILQQAFPECEIVGIDCCALIKQHGSLHCVTMQYPVGVIV